MFTNIDSAVIKSLFVSLPHAFTYKTNTDICKREKLTDSLRTHIVFVGVALFGYKRTVLNNTP